MRHKGRLFLAFMLVVCCTFAACDGFLRGEHTHTYTSTWKHNDTYHWQESTCGCQEAENAVLHTLNAENTCTVCGYVMQATEDIVYQLAEGGVAAIVTSYTGAATEVVIASQYQGIPVTDIGYFAFDNGYSITSIIIPESVQAICDYAFYGCDGMQTITLPSGLLSISEFCFKNCSSLSAIIFTGSMQQWNDMTKADGWDRDILATQVVCLGGTVAL